MDGVSDNGSGQPGALVLNKMSKYEGQGEAHTGVSTHCQCPQQRLQ
jgi:hypothetical protein